MESLKIPEEISDFSEIKYFSAVKEGKEFIITLSKKLKKSEGTESFQAITLGYSVEGSDKLEVLQEMLKYIVSK